MDETAADSLDALAEEKVVYVSGAGSENTLHVEIANGGQCAARQTRRQSGAARDADSVVAQTEDLEAGAVAGTERVAQQTDVGVGESAVCW